jgi:hypothetical protein
MKELPSGLIGPVTNIINKVVPDKDEAAPKEGRSSIKLLHLALSHLFKPL